MFIIRRLRSRPLNQEVFEEERSLATGKCSPKEMHPIGTAGSPKASMRASQYLAPHPQTKCSKPCVRETWRSGSDACESTRACKEAGMEQTQNWRST